MTLITDTITPRNKLGTTIKFDSVQLMKVDNYKIKFTSRYDKRIIVQNLINDDNSTKELLIFPSVQDNNTGGGDYFANPYFRGYVQIHNDNNYGVIGVESHDSLTTECHTNSYNGSGSSNLGDGIDHNVHSLGVRIINQLRK